MFKTSRSKRKYVIALVFLSIFLFSLFSSAVYADDDDWWDWLEEKKEEAERKWEETKREAEDWWDRTKEQGEQRWEETEKQAREQYERYRKEAEEDIRNAEDWLLQIKEKTTSNVEQAIAMAKEVSGPYRREAWTIIEAEKRRQVCSQYSDPARVGALETKRPLLTEGIILAIKLLPYYDEEQGTIQTYDGFAREMVNQTPGLAGSDLAKDPVRCAALMLLDSDYLMYAKIVQTPNGMWISLREAQECGYNMAEAVAAISQYEEARRAFAWGNPQRVEIYMKEFSSEVVELNNERDASAIRFDPLWVLPFGVITIIGASYVAWEQETTKSAEIVKERKSSKTKRSQ